MESHLDLMVRLFGKRFMHSLDTTPKPRGVGKHQASKRGYQHKHNLSRGQRNHLAWKAGGNG